MIGAGAAWQTLLKKTREKIDDHTKALKGGNFKDYAEAKVLAARIESLDWVITQASEILGDNPKQSTQNVDEEED